MVVIVGGEKGGTGKTTLAVNLAAYRTGEGYEVLIVDTDRQGSASFWAQTRAENEKKGHIPCVQKFGKNLPKDVMSLASKYEDIIIDAGGRDSMELRYGLDTVLRLRVKSWKRVPESELQKDLEEQG